MIDAVLRLVDTEAGFTGPVNLGNPGESTILELAETALELTRSKSRLMFRPLPEDDPRRRKPDISLARKKLSWEPKIDLKEGLERTIDYFENLLQGLTNSYRDSE